MNHKLYLSLGNIEGNNGGGNPKGALANPTVAGWYYDAYFGWHYRDEQGRIYAGDLYTGLVYMPLAFFPNYEYPATKIRADAPIPVMEGDKIQITARFQWKGDARTIRFRFGSCRKVLAHYEEGDHSIRDVSVSASLDFKTYTLTGTFTYDGRPHLYILPEGIEWDVVYQNAFTTVVGEFKDLEITEYARA